MNKFERMQAIQKLEEKKETLLEKLSKIDKELKKEQGECNHISVDLGYYDIFPSSSDEYCCLICGKGKNRGLYFVPEKNIVHAEKYLPELDITDDAQCVRKIESIQELAFRILREYPSLSDQELVNRLNSIIEKRISSNETDKVIRMKPISKK